MAATSNRMTFKWNKWAACWMVDIADVNGAPIISGVAVVTGADLLEQFKYLNLGGQLIAQTDHNTDAVPTFKNLGKDGHVYYATP